MKYSFQLMTQQQAEEIADYWHYEGQYSFYDMDADQEDLQEFLDPEKRRDSYFVVMDQAELIGFYSFTQVMAGTIDIGLGLKPNLTGKGNGAEFLKAGLEFAQSEYNPKQITLSVAAFNTRAINLYKNHGFTEVEHFLQKTNGGSFEFLKMIYHC